MVFFITGPVLVFLALLAIVTGNAVLQIDLAPYFSIVFFAMTVVYLIMGFKSNRDEKSGEADGTNVSPAMNFGCAGVCLLLFIIMACSSCTVGNVLSDVWHHI